MVNQTLGRHVAQESNSVEEKAEGDMNDWCREKVGEW